MSSWISTFHSRPDNSELERMELLRQAKEEIKNSLLDRFGERAALIVPPHVFQPNEKELREWLKDERRIEFRDDGIYQWKGDTLIHGMISGSVVSSLLVQDLDFCRDGGLVDKSALSGLLRSISASAVSDLIPDVQLCLKNGQGRWTPTLVVDVDTESMRSLEEWYMRADSFSKKSNVNLYLGVKVWLRSRTDFTAVVYICDLEEYRSLTAHKVEGDDEYHLVPQQVVLLGEKGEFEQKHELDIMLRKWNMTMDQITSPTELKLPTNSLYGPEHNHKKNIKVCEKLPEFYSVSTKQLERDIRDVLHQRYES